MGEMRVTKRVIAYIDGFNLYFGLRSHDWQRYYWLNVHGMAQSLLKPDQKLVCTKYFTSRVKNDPMKQKRQNDFLEAIQTIPDVMVYYGKYQLNPRSCRFCGRKEYIPNEKMTDVNIAVEMLADAFTDAFDIALLVSADSDLVAPVRKVKSLFPNKRIVICFPPQRHSADLEKAAGIFTHINRAVLAANQFPDRLEKPDGYILTRPDKWR
jgi:uncharacterized LabA/DUF88 family protein